MTLTTSARGLADHAASLVRLEIRLALTEIRAKVRSLERAAVFGAVAALTGFLALVAGIGAAAAGLATTMPVWLALLLVFVALGGIAAAAALAALGAARRALPPVPTTAIREARRTIDVVRNGRGR
jgi:hypothetical protein